MCVSSEFSPRQGRRGENNASVNTFWMASTQQVETQAILKNHCLQARPQKSKEGVVIWVVPPLHFS